MATSARHAHLSHAPQIITNVEAANVDAVSAHAATEHEAPACVLTDATLVRWTLEAAEVPATELEPTPSHLVERIAWMQAIYANAWRDRRLLASIKVPGSTLSESDVVEFGFSLTLLSRASARRQEAGAPAVKTAVTVLNKSELNAQMKKKRTTVCSALDLRFSGDSEKRAEVRAIRNMKQVREVASANDKVFKLCDDRETDTWLRTLPSRAGVALDELRALEAERLRRKHTSAATPPRFLARAWHLAQIRLAPIMLRGRFLVDNGLKDRSEYPAFKRPAARSRRVVKTAPVTHVTTPVTTPVHG